MNGNSELVQKMLGYIGGDDLMQALQQPIGMTIGIACDFGFELIEPAAGRSAADSHSPQAVGDRTGARER